jgi:hypothetical protein
LAAAFFPAGIATVIWILSAPPALPRAIAYLAGACTSTLIGGVVILTLMGSVGSPAEHPGVTAGFEIGVGTSLLVLVGVLAVRKPSLHVDRPRGRSTRRGHVAMFLLGAAMWTPSLAYVAALELIAEAQLSLTGVVLNLLIVVFLVLSPVAATLVGYVISPERAARALATLRARLAAIGWRVGAGIAGVGGVYLLAKGWRRAV